MPIMNDLSQSSSDEPWALWTKEQSVLELSQKQTDSLHLDANNKIIVSSGMAGQGLHTPGIDRNQYRAVLQRMNQAAHKVGTFANWENK